jgi:hypothetical protein
MTCKEYIFKLTSGQLDDAGLIERFWARQHRLMCRRCRAFTTNDEKLGVAVRAYRAHLGGAPKK